MPLYITRKDITKMKCDAIVNTTNEQMIGFSGVDLAIHRLAGEELDKECGKLAPLNLGCAKITRGYNLSCKYVIHTSVPVWDGGENGEKEIFKSCYLESLKLAKEYKLKKVAFPLISTGANGFPKDQALSFAVDTIANFLKDNEMTVYLCVFDKTSYELSKNLLERLRKFICKNFENEDLICYESEICLPANEKEGIEEAFPFNPVEKRRSICKFSSADNSLIDFLKNKTDGFTETLFYFIDKKGISDVECYKRANVTKQVFSKIKKPNYKPTKPTVLAFAIALKLSLKETKDLLESAGFVLAHNNTFDLIVEYCITHKYYNINRVNEILFDFDENLLGSISRE